MVGVTSLVVLACAWAVGSNAQPLSEVCKLIETGSIDGPGIPLAETILQPGIADWEILIPNVPNCPYGLVGARAVVCDNDVLLSARFITTNKISVHRVGSLQGPGSVTPTVYCGNPLTLNNQPLLENNPMWLSRNQPWQTNTQLQNDVSSHSHSWGQSPLKLWNQSTLPSLGVTPQSQWDQTPNPLLTQSHHSVWDQSPQSVWGQSPLPSLSVTPQSQWDQTPNPLWGQMHHSVRGKSPLPSLGVTPQTLLGQTHQSVRDQSPYSTWSQSPQSMWGQSPQPLMGQTSQNLIAQQL